MRATRVDGNALAGMLTELFADPTTMVVTCGGCGAAAVLAEVVVELDGTAAIVLCRGCTHTLFTVIRDASSTRLIVGTAASLSS